MRFSKKRANVRSLRHLVTIEKLKRHEGDYDGIPEEWETHCEAWASIRPIRGKEMIANQGFDSQKLVVGETHTIRLRWQDGITSAMRVIHKSRKFNITGVINVGERNTCIELTAVEES